MIAICTVKKPALFYRKIKFLKSFNSGRHHMFLIFCKYYIFDELQPKYISLNAPDFLQVNRIWYNLKKLCPLFLETFVVFKAF